MPPMASRASNWDLITVNGPATLSGISISNPLTVDVVNYGGLNGAVGPTNTVTWDFLDASGGITGYASNAFAVTTTGWPVGPMASGRLRKWATAWIYPTRRFPSLLPRLW